MTFKYRALVTAPPILPKINDYVDLFNNKSVEIVTPPYKVIESLDEQELIILLNNIDGIICGDDAITEAVLKETSKLKIISKWGTGIDSIDKNAANKLGIKVSRVKNVFAEPVSDTVLAYIFLFSRNIIEKNRLVKNNEWKKVDSFTLKEKSLGVIGLGHIGKTVARKAAQLGMELYGCDTRDISKDFLKSTKINLVTLDELLKKSDFITLHCDLNETSLRLIGEKELVLMKPNAIIINTSRGQVIDQKALEIALQNQTIGGAALDVFEVEPLPSNNILKKLENVLLSPHNSNGSPEVFKEVDCHSINNLFEGLGLL